MKRTSIGTFALAFALSGISLAAAQDRSSNGNTTGSAAPRGGDSGGGATSRGGDSGGSSGSSGSSSSGGSMSAPSSWPSYEAPRRAGEESSRSGGAVSRGRTGGGSTAASSGVAGEPRGAAPAYSRPRDGRTVTGTAVDRGSVPPVGGGGGNGIIYYPYYYNPWSFWGPGYGYGLGYLFYDPWSGSGYGWGDPFGYGGYGYGGYGYGGGGSGGYAVSREYRDSGNLRLKIDPKQAQVYVDGYYVGVVDSFDGAFQKLGLDAGDHKIELKADGFEPLQFEVLIAPGETVTYKGDMRRIRK
jgi:hypothetical protein